MIMASLVFFKIMTLNHNHKPLTLNNDEMIKSKTFLFFFLACLFTLTSKADLIAQESTRSHVVTEYDGKQYYIHAVTKKQSLKDIADIYGVSVYEIMKENKDVKKNPKAGTYLRIPYKAVEEELVLEDIIANDGIVEDTMSYVHEYVSTTFDAERLYKVALMMPLYLEQVDDEFMETEVSSKQLLSKPFSYLHFYEGFMVAVDSMVNSLDMKLDLKVYDVDQDTNKVKTALNDAWLVDADIIIGPFHVKTFERVLNFAKENDILIVNPMTNRDDMVVGNRNLVKVKPSYRYQMHWLDSLIKDKYVDNNIFIIAEDTSKMDYAFMIEEIANKNINQYSLVPNQHIKKVIKKHHDAWMIEEIEFDENTYQSDNITLDVSLINQNPDDSTMLKNQVIISDYSTDSLNEVKKIASSIRNNVFIVYGDNRVFATDILNQINIISNEFPSELVALPDWSKFDRLFNENLMKLNTIYFDDDYTDYNTYSVGKFICKFRDTYGTEPKDIAYHGFNIAWYFLNALMNYGDDINIGVTLYDIPLLNTRYRFERQNAEDGVENTYWNLYQYQDYEKKLLRYE